MKNIFSTDDSVKRQITNSIGENLTDSDLESKFITLNEHNFFFKSKKLFFDRIEMHEFV